MNRKRKKNSGILKAEIVLNSQLFGKGHKGWWGWLDRSCRDMVVGLKIPISMDSLCLELKGSIQVHYGPGTIKKPDVTSLNGDDISINSGRGKL